MRLANACERLAGIHVAHLVALGEEFVDAGEDVVAEHHRDLEPGRDAQHLARAGHRIHAAGIGDHFDVPRLAACAAMRPISGGKSRA